MHRDELFTGWAFDVINSGLLLQSPCGPAVRSKRTPLALGRVPLHTSTLPRSSDGGVGASASAQAKEALGLS